VLMWTRHSLLAETPPRRGGSVLWAGLFGRASRAFRAFKPFGTFRTFRIIPANNIRVEPIEHVLLCVAFAVFAPTLGSN